MSLVAYAASSDEDSDNDEGTSATQVELIKPSEQNENTKNNNKEISTNIEESKSTNGHISDEDDDYVPQDVSLQELRSTNARFTLSLPKPKISSTAPRQEDEEEGHQSQHDDQVTQSFAKLPVPRAVGATRTYIEEVDDEFLHKKAVPTSAGNMELEKPPPAAVKTRVKISIPSLRDFADVDKEKAAKEKSKRTELKPKGSGLLNLLPKAKSEQDFSKKKSEPSNKEPVAPKAAHAFVPDTVKQRRTAHNTEAVDGIKAKTSKPSTSKPSKPSGSLVTVSDSDDDDDAGSAGDFFSLNSEQKPEVSSNEITALVAKRAAKIVEASNKFLAEESEREAAEAEAAKFEAEELRQAQQRYHEQHLNAEAMDALVGKNAKRRRKEAQEMQVIDISGSQVLPDREEWMRTALASATTFQPTGVLTDEEPVAGTRRKHQITYLAHKAKANEAELQAMWSANRQTRRATQGKYGF